MAHYIQPVQYCKYAFKGDFFEDQLVIAVTRDREDVRQLLVQADDILTNVWHIYLREVRKGREERGATRSPHMSGLDLSSPQHGRRHSWPKAVQSILDCGSH